MMNAIEALRERYRPTQVRLLFLGESPPVSGQFFYQGGTDLELYTRRAHERAFSMTFATSHDFLDFFQASGSWLDDICHLPVNHLASRQRRSALRESLADLSCRLQACSPDEIVVVVKRVHPLVCRAVKTAGLDVPVHALPFPGYRWQDAYRRGLEEILRSAIDRRLLLNGTQT